MELLSPEPKAARIRRLPGRAPAKESDVVETLRGLALTLDSRLNRLDALLTEAVTRLEPPAPTALALTRAAAPQRVSVYCMGTFRLVVDGAPFAEWQSGKSRALFQYLVTHRDRTLSRDALIQALWPDPGANAPATSLKVAVHSLRQTLAAIEAADEPLPLSVQAHGAGYSLSTTDVWVDVEVFEQCFAAARALEVQGQFGGARALYRRAVDLYGGDFLEDVEGDWPAFRREALKDRHLSALMALAKAAHAEGDNEEAILRSQQVLARDSCREDAYRILLLSHAQLGQRSRVRSWYDLCVRSLRAELDCDPEPETTRIYRLAMNGRRE
jgi:DNA-binding SARP family transcriptional activator